MELHKRRKEKFFLAMNEKKDKIGHFHDNFSTKLFLNNFLKLLSLNLKKESYLKARSIIQI